MATELELKEKVDSTKHLELLKELKSINDKEGFNELLYQILAPVRKYVKHEIRIAEIKGVISENLYQATEVMDDLLIKTYDSIPDIDVSHDVLSWLFQQADLILNDLYEEEEFNAFFFKNIDDLSKAEQDAMEEEITRDGDGDLVLLEELDDQSYSNYEYVLDDVFISNPEKSIIDGLDAGLLKEKAEQSIAKLIRFLPSRMRSVYNLHHYGLDARSISFIKRIPMDSVSSTIHKVRRTLRHLISLELEKSGVDKK